MDDKLMVDMIYERNEDGIRELVNTYSRLCTSVVCRILSDECDVEECVSDVWMAVWNSIPPNRPDSIRAYLCKIARRIGIDKLKYNTRKKRADGYTVLLSELGDCIALPEDNECDEHLIGIIENFLSSIDVESRVMFVRRYMYMESIAELASRYGIKERYISVKLFRIREKLRKALVKEGIEI